MRYFSTFSAICLCILIVACATTSNNTNRGGDGAFNNSNTDLSPFGVKKGVTVIENQPSAEEELRFGQYLEVMSFRGVQMPKLLARFDVKDREGWQLVRRKVHPAPRRPAQWPPASEDRLSEEQKAYRQWLYWPKLVRERLSADDWDSSSSRQWLARQGRLYELVYRFEAENNTNSQAWRTFAEAMLMQGDDGQQLLISCMIVRLGHDNMLVVGNAQNILVDLGEPAIQPLLDVLWVFQAGNMNFNKQVVATLARMGRSVVGAAIIELRESPRGGVTWRSRRFFVDLLGQMGDPRAVQAIVEEIEKADITEYRAVDGVSVPDKQATDEAIFMFHEYCINALGKIPAWASMGPIIDLWEKNPDHIDGATNALFNLTRQRVKTVEEARLLAERLKPKPKDGK